MSYLRITVTTDAGPKLTYKPLDPDAEHTDDDLAQMAIAVAGGYPWIWEVVDNFGTVTASGQRS